MGHTLNPTTGKPSFNNGPSTTADFQASADYTERIGEASVTTVADLEAIPYPRRGEHRYVIADGGVYVYNGAGWDRTVGVSHVQLDTANSTARMVTQYGMGKIVGAASASVSKTVTFPKAFASVPFITVDYIGARATGAFNVNGLTDFAPALVLKGFGPTTTGLSATAHRTDGVNLIATWDFYFSWSATGVLA